MSRYLLVFALPFIFVALPPAPAAPVPKHLMRPGPELYYPTRVGTKWVYVDADFVEWHVVITKVELKDGEFHVTEAHTRKSSSVNRTLTMAVSHRGVFHTGCSDFAHDPPICWLQLPTKPDERWYDGDWVTQAEPEEVETPAGKFRAIPVTRQTDDPRMPNLGIPRRSSTRWFAPGVGPVRLSIGERDHFILKSFTPGKD